MTYENFLFNALETQARRLVKENYDPQDTITVDVPLFIRLLELAREDIKSDVELHNVVERTLSLKNHGTLTMDNYEAISGIPSSSTNEPTQPSIDLSEIRKLAGLK
jgi:hypothetical protein